jgi:asparagine synthase (glutamine-hydrolysing)
VARFDRLPVPGLRTAASLAWPLLPYGTKGKNFLRHVAQDRAGRYLDSIAMFPADERAALYAPGVRASLALDSETILGRHFDRFAGLPHDGRIMRFDFETYLPEDVLTKVDRMSMAHSIETRVPMLDNQVIDFAATLPSRFKIRNGRRKHVLKETLRPMLPPGILDRKKQGFGIPLGAWFRGGLTDLFSDVLEAPRTKQRGYFEPAFVSRLLKEHVAGQRDHTHRLWQLLVFELWHRQYLDAAAAGASTAHVR